MSNDKEIAVVESAPEALQDALEIIESRNALFNRVMSVALAATNSSDWIDQAGKPYLQGSGAEKVARRFGIRIFDVVIERENITDDNGPYYIYTVTGKAGLGSGGESIETIGTCSSRDRLFGHVGGKLRPMQDVDLCNVKKKAYTNFMGNAITRLLGIRNLTWDELAKYKIYKGGVSVNYKSASEKAADTKTAAKAESTAKKPYWTNTFNNKEYVHAKVGQHYGSEFLLGLGMKASTKTIGNYSCESNDTILNALEAEYMAAEEMLAKEES